MSVVDIGDAGEFWGSEKGLSLISAYRSLAFITNTPRFIKLSTALHLCKSKGKQYNMLYQNPYSDWIRDVGQPSILVPLGTDASIVILHTMYLQFEKKEET